jgi:hypothetical protein
MQFQPILLQIKCCLGRFKTIKAFFLSKIRNLAKNVDNLARSIGRIQSRFVTKKIKKIPPDGLVRQVSCKSA